MAKVKTGSILAAAAVAGLIAGTMVPTTGSSIGNQAFAEGGCSGGCGGKDKKKCEDGKECECKGKDHNCKEGDCNHDGE